MLRSALKAMVLVTAAAMLTACQSSPRYTGKADTQPVPIQRHLSGNDAALRMPTVMLVNSKAELTAIGSQDLVNKDVDFARNSLVVLALGQKPTGGYWALVTGVQKLGDELYVQGIANRPAKDAAVTQAVTHPYDAVVVPKIPAAKIRSEIESVQGKALPQTR